MNVKGITSVFDPKKIFLLIFLLIFSFGLMQIRPSPLEFKIFAQSPEDKLKQLNEEIEQYKNEINRLKSQANTLSNQIAQYDAQIKLTGLKISEIEEQVALLGNRINLLETSLNSLTQAFSQRAEKTYKMARLGETFILLISATDLSEMVSSFHYLKRIQEADRDLLLRLEEAQANYKEEKVEQEDLQAELEEQKKALDAQKFAKANLLEITRNDEKRYQSLLAQAVAQKNAFLRFISEQGGASILENQTVCDSWGCYYNQRDSQWGNNSLGVSGLSVAGYGCLVSSIAMIASHQGIDIKPSDIASSPSAFFGDTAYLLNDFSVNGVSVKKTHVSKSLLDGELSAGRPVVAGLYGGPDHFIVILKKEGDQYIMHDPFLENGANRPLSDKYNVSDISSLRLISFN